jgi:hypothetical protein
MLNIHHEPVVCATVTTEKDEVYLYETIDTSGHPHTADYLSKIVGNLIRYCSNEYNCTDNAVNMNKMQEECHGSKISFRSFFVLCGFGRSGRPMGSTNAWGCTIVTRTPRK